MKFQHQESVKQRNGIVRLLFVVIPIIVAFVAISLFSVNRWYNNNLNAVDTNSVSEITFVIEPGDSVRDIASDLQAQGVIRNATAFSWYVSRSSEWDDLQAGTYNLSPSQRVEDIVEKLATGDVATNQVTIFPGRRVDQLVDDFLEAGFTQQEINQAFNADYSNAILKDRPAGATLEGYLFPETYSITADDTLTDIFSRALDELNNRITEDMRKSFSRQNLDLHEAVSLASIVGAEVSEPDVQKDVAAVFLNRLEQDIVLGADPTFLYAAAVSDQEASPQLDHPYNTRLYGGIPPGPIGNFNFSALEAVADPTDSDFIFFVSGDDGITYFARTAAEHQANVDKYCDENCRLP